jgi:hypothetical protein
MVRRTVRSPIGKSLISVSSLVKHLMTELGTIAANYMPEVACAALAFVPFGFVLARVREVVSNVSPVFKKLF